MDDKANQDICEKQQQLKISVQALRYIVREALSSEGAILPDPHCFSHMKDRNFELEDIITILDGGNYHRYPASWDEKHREWIYSVVGEDLEGKRLKVLFTVVDADMKIRIISAQRFYKRKRV